MAEILTEQARFAAHRDFWAKTVARRGDGYVGRQGESHKLQQKRIEDLLRTRLNPNVVYQDMIDFGCGWGRFVPFWSQFVGHIWAVDLLNDLLVRAKQAAPIVSTVSAQWPFRIPMNQPRIDLLWACLVFQHITDESLLTNTLAELARVMKPGARVLIIDNAVDKAPHVKPRGPEFLAEKLKLLPGWSADKVTINNRPNDHWLLDGQRA